MITSNRRNRREGDVFIKHHGGNVAEDLDRAQRWWNLCNGVDGLAAPRPLWKDEIRAEIGYEWLPDLHPLLSSRTQIARRVWELGRLLAILHARSDDQYASESNVAIAYMPEELSVPEYHAEILRDRFPVVFFHGDCWHGNAFWREDGSFVILDPIPNSWLFDRKRRQACAAVDLAMMHMSLFLCHSATTHLSRGILPFYELAAALLDGYLGANGQSQRECERPLLSLSHAIAVKHVEAYALRLFWPVAKFKARIGRVIISELERVMQWSR